MYGYLCQCSLHVNIQYGGVDGTILPVLHGTIGLNKTNLMLLFLSVW